MIKEMHFVEVKDRGVGVAYAMSEGAFYIEFTMPKPNDYVEGDVYAETILVEDGKTACTSLKITTDIALALAHLIDHAFKFPEEEEEAAQVEVPR